MFEKLPTAALDALEAIYPKAETEAIRELTFGEARAAAIVAAAMVDDALKAAIEIRLRMPSKTIRDRLTGDGGAIGAFAVRIDLGYAMALFGRITRCDLHLIRKVRNGFAHKAEFRSFDHPEIKKFCVPLAILKHTNADELNDIASNSRDKYLASAMVIYEELKNLTNQGKKPVDPGLLP